MEDLELLIPKVELIWWENIYMKDYFWCYWWLHTSTQTCVLVMCQTDWLAKTKQRSSILSKLIIPLNVIICLLQSITLPKAVFIHRVQGHCLIIFQHLHHICIFHEILYGLFSEKTIVLHNKQENWLRNKSMYDNSNFKWIWTFIWNFVS